MVRTYSPAKAQFGKPLIGSISEAILPFYCGQTLIVWSWDQLFLVVYSMPLILRDRPISQHSQRTR